MRKSKQGDFSESMRKSNEGYLSTVDGELSSNYSSLSSEPEVLVMGR
jgi:hypothetical protein